MPPAGLAQHPPARRAQHQALGKGSTTSSSVSRLRQRPPVRCPPARRRCRRCAAGRSIASGPSAPPRVVAARHPPSRSATRSPPARCPHARATARDAACRGIAWRSPSRRHPTAQFSPGRVTMCIPLP
jgi:hypothetical protein